ncbi:MAG TPA: helix-turn-helix domain-containing protein [Solirubrobacterales bacterium]
MTVESIESALSHLSEQLRERAGELEEPIFDQMRRFSGAGEEAGAQVDEDLHAISHETVHYLLTCIQLEDEWSPSPPPLAIAEARRAAREGVELDDLLRKYVATDGVFAEFVLERFEDLPPSVLRVVLRGAGISASRLVADLAAAYLRELERARDSVSIRFERRVERLLSGESVSRIGEIAYDFDGWHIGLVVSGLDAAPAAKRIAAQAGRQALVLPHEERIAWAWLGGSYPLAYEQLERAVLACGDEISIAVGEAHRGLAGWRLTHREARAGFEVVATGRQRVVRARDVSLLVAILRNNELKESLRRNYGDPLRDPELRRTVRAYFASGLNGAAAAAILSVDRHTVQRRLRRVEENLGRPLHACQAELKVALDLEDIEHPE